MLYKYGFKNIKGYEIDATLDNPYKSVVEYKSFICSPLSERFNVVIGNPPYIRWKNLEDNLKRELAQSDLWNKYFNSLCDYLFIFILKSIEQLKENGELIFICPEYWLNTTHSETLRNYMCVNVFFSDIYLFKEAPLFESVTSSFIIFRYVKKKMYPHNIFKQYEYLNDLYRTHPKAISLEDKKALFESPVALFLLSRGDSATRLWNPQNIFEEKQNDTADILFHDNKFFEVIDVKTRNMAKSTMAPNIISAYKVAQICTFIIDNEE